jgi:3',5'-cyclic AMP phosphodiesterase CpdA
MSVDLLIVSDTHLAPDNPEANANWDAIVDHVATTLPEAVVHLGDLTVNGADEAEHLSFARHQLDRLAVPWFAIPGNHDIGDNPIDGVTGPSTITERRRERWESEIGPTRWTLSLDGWTVVAIDAQLFTSGLQAEAEQWTWLEQTMAALAPDEAVALAVHKPLTAPEHELSAAPPYRFVPAAAASRLLTPTSRSSTAMVLSGHVHQFRILDVDGTRHVWAPTAWATLPDNSQPTFGFKRIGAVSLCLDGDRPGQATMIEPYGIEQQTIGVDAPNPYDRVHPQERPSS